MSSAFHLCVASGGDLSRRLNSVGRVLLDRLGCTVALTHTPIPELRSAVATEKPDLILVEIGLAMSGDDLPWLRESLAAVRKRFERCLPIVLCLTAPERFSFAGDLLFENDTSLQPSGLVDDLLITPPPILTSAPTLEEQCVDLLSFRLNTSSSLPPLNDEAWVPALGDPESREIWFRWVPRYARYTKENPLVVGPSGSGKTRLAAALHSLSGREGPFVSITPRDFSSPELIQAELFGAAAGAYTGAVDKWGLVKKAERGTLFIDELQSIDFDLQGKLITFIENKTYRRVGEAESRQADVRFVFATNKTLEELVRTDKLRDDFAYRLERLEIVMKPLSERRLDIAAGICFALAKIFRERRDAFRGARVEGLDASAYQQLMTTEWPGNLRQLENTVARLIEVASIRGEKLIEGETVGEAMAGLLGQLAKSPADVLNRALQHQQQLLNERQIESLPALMDSLSETARREAIASAGGDTAQAAKLLGEHEKHLELFLKTRGQLPIA